MAETKPAMRDALIAAAFQLFLDRGYEQTTIDDIVALAGVGRRSFFRYFPSKEGVVFPDHERCLEEITAFLAEPAEDEAGGVDPVRRVCAAARLVMRMYARDREFSVQRYQLTRTVPGLRSYELSVVWRYEHTFARYLRSRWAGRPDGSLRGEVVAAAVVAAHNHALRSWLRSGGETDIEAATDHALELVVAAWAEPGADPGQAQGAAEDDLVVLVARRGVPMWRVVRGIEAALEEEPGEG
ncbi:TetR/AcrR family transcriptional regulator [Phaeacidiphilus oryzae]|jgi:AcrR family transcriptional regulator|uniref:TetR/AcrR family transcriptional regulator n=1 Tax=Phaeacidiphilus oryzae TaxID=348818 RepID=UPI000ACB5CA5|nr:TetR family transcriptional regulator [Phaeacidiphilus oryzae]